VRGPWVRVDPYAEMWAGIRTERPDCGLQGLNDAETAAILWLWHVATERVDLRFRSGLRHVGEELLGVGRERRRRVWAIRALALEHYLLQETQAAADLIGLPGREYHWIVDLALAHHGRFYSHGAGDWYLDAKGFLEHADWRDLENRELVRLAHRAVDEEERRHAGQ
jgi:hypothetical protein